MKENDIKNLNFMTQTNETQDVLKRKNCKKGNLSFLNEKNSLACVCQLNWFWQSAHTHHSNQCVFRNRQRIYNQKNCITMIAIVLPIKFYFIFYFQQIQNQLQIHTPTVVVCYYFPSSYLQSSSEFDFLLLHFTNNFNHQTQHTLSFFLHSLLLIE